MSQFEQQMDRLVDGELSPEERRQLLQELEQREGGWRACALAFLEAQSWTDAWQDLAEQSQPLKLESGMPLADPHLQLPEESRPFVPREVQPRLAIAAAILLAFLAGSKLQPGRSTEERVPGTNGVRSLAQQQELRAPAGGAEQGLAAIPQDGDVVTMWTNGRGGKRQQIEVPLVDARAVERAYGLQFRSGISNAMRDHLKQEGYEVRSNQYFAPLWVDNDRPLIVPVEDTQITPVSRQVW